MKSKTAVITGATGGIGIEICKYLLQNGYRILASCRNPQRGKQLCETLKKTAGTDGVEKLFLLNLDLLSFHSVELFAKEVAAWLQQQNAGIDLLINNAGIIAPRFQLTADGYESSLQVNYLSPRRLTGLLLPYLSPSGKVINTVSCTIRLGRAEFPGRKNPEQQKKEFVSLKNYSNSKLLLALYTIRLHRELNGIFVCGADPGIVDTGIITQHRWYDPLASLFFRPFIKRPAQGALPIFRAIEYPAANLPTGNPPLLFKGSCARYFPKKILTLAASVEEPS